MVCHCCVIDHGLDQEYNCGLVSWSNRPPDEPHFYSWVCFFVQKAEKQLHNCSVLFSVTKIREFNIFLFWKMTVDGTHVWIAEPGHEIYSQDSSNISFKFNKVSINYELGIVIASGRCIWLNSLFKSGRNDF